MVLMRWEGAPGRAGDGGGGNSETPLVCTGPERFQKVTPKHREALSARIHEEAVDLSIVSMPPSEIDAVNIYQATMEAMYQAVKNLHVKPDAVIVDAMPLHFSCPTIP